MEIRCFSSAQAWVLLLIKNISVAFCHTRPQYKAGSRAGSCLGGDE